jgi:RNA polymerase sigma-70 factor (ECF subfamily)
METTLRHGHEVRDEIVLRAQGGEAEAFAELYALYRMHIYRLCFKMTKNDAEAEDCTQETFIRMLKSIKSFHGEAQFSTWLYRIATNLILMRWRRKDSKNHESIDELIETDSGFLQRHIAVTDAHQAFTVERIACARALAQMSTEDRTILYLRDVEGYRCSEIAEMLGTTVATAKSRVFRARREMLFLLGIKEDPLKALSNFDRFLSDEEEPPKVH